MGYLERVFRATEEENRRVILDALEPRDGGALLDLGCADGAVTARVAERARVERVVGVELIDHLADAARARGMEVVTDNFLREIRRLLKPDGYAVVSTNNLASWHNVASLVLGWQPPPCHPSDEVIVGNPVGVMEGAPGARGQMHLRVFTGRALAGVARHHGLRPDLVATAGYYPFPVAIARILNRLDPRHGAFLVQRYRTA
jgi:SAM-dependent methyltransferase